MSILEMLNLELRLLVEIGKPFAISFVILVGIQFIVYRIFKFSIFNELLKATLKEINK